MVSYFRRTRSVMFSCQNFQSRYFSEVHGPAAFEATLKFMCLVWANQWQVLKTEISNWIVLHIFSEVWSVFSSKKLSVYLQKSPELIMAHLWIFFHSLSWYIYCISLITTLWIFLWQRYVKYKLFTAEVMLGYNFILFCVWFNFFNLFLLWSAFLGFVKYWPGYGIATSFSAVLLLVILPLSF